MGYQVSLLDSSHRARISERNRRSCLLGSHLMFLAAAFYTGHSFYLCCLAFEILYVLENTSIEETNVNEISTWQLWHAATRKLKNIDRNQIPLPAHLIVSPYDNCFTLTLIIQTFLILVLDIYCALSIFQIQSCSPIDLEFTHLSSTHATEYPPLQNSGFLQCTWEENLIHLPTS